MQKKAKDIHNNNEGEGPKTIASKEAASSMNVGLAGILSLKPSACNTSWCCRHNW